MFTVSVGHTYPQYRGLNHAETLPVTIPSCESTLYRMPRVRSRVRARVHAHARVPLRRASLSRSFRHGKAAPSVEFGALEQMYRGGLLACHRTDDYAMPTDWPEGQETQLQ